MCLSHESSLGVLGRADTRSPSAFGQAIPGVGRAQRTSSAPAGCSWGKRRSGPESAECPISRVSQPCQESPAQPWPCRGSLLRSWTPGWAGLTWHRLLRLLPTFNKGILYTHSCLIRHLFSSAAREGKKKSTFSM